MGYVTEGHDKLDDLNKLDLYVTREWPNGVTVAFRGENLTDEDTEVVPFYGVQGREFFLTINYKW